jgi:hypothetical protein
MKIRIASAWQTVAVLLLLGRTVQASLGDRLPDFKACVQVWKTLKLHRNLILTTLRSVKKPIAAETLHQYVRYHPEPNPHPSFRNSLSRSLPPPHPPLGLPLRMRLHLPTHHDRKASRARPTIHAAHLPVPRQMALLPLPGHARALLSVLLPPQLPRAPERSLENNLPNPAFVSAPQILRHARICWDG